MAFVTLCNQKRSDLLFENLIDGLWTILSESRIERTEECKEQPKPKHRVRQRRLRWVKQQKSGQSIETKMHCNGSNEGGMRRTARIGFQ
jgi:hypothetical protein